MTETKTKDRSRNNNILSLSVARECLPFVQVSKIVHMMTWTWENLSWPCAHYLTRFIRLDWMSYSRILYNILVEVLGNRHNQLDDRVQSTWTHTGRWKLESKALFSSQKKFTKFFKFPVTSNLWIHVWSMAQCLGRAWAAGLACSAGTGMAQLLGQHDGGPITLCRRMISEDLEPSDVEYIYRGPKPYLPISQSLAPSLLDSSHPHCCTTSPRSHPSSLFTSRECATLPSHLQSQTTFPQLQPSPNCSPCCTPAPACPVGTACASWNTHNMVELLQHMSKTEKIYVCNICSIQIKHLQHISENNWNIWNTHF
jgi:hypothetical protein